MRSPLYDQVKNMALMLLRPQERPEEQHVRTAVQAAVSAFAAMGATPETVDQEALYREIQSIRYIWTPNGTLLADQTDHEPWLPEKRGTIPWDFWRRYELYLEQGKGMPPQVVARLDGLTDRILENLEDPRRRGAWDRRGMVVGQVQSGKTANYTGLICKAVDAGYKLIIVLAGIHNSLRSQTQLRLDEGFLGRDTKIERVYTQGGGAVIGAGLFHVGDRRPSAHSLTSSADNGDFSRTSAHGVAAFVGNDPVLLVIKKNGSILRNLLQWVRGTLGERVSQTGEPEKWLVRGVPMLVLDDEADNASINTRRLEEDERGRFRDRQELTRINKLMRQLLDTFEQSAYVGYTATPFANIFIPPDGRTVEEGEDLFPRSFIINLPAPSNYIGPVQVFGLDGEGEALPIVRVVNDFAAQIPETHTQHHRPDELPASLREAIRAFLLSCAARRARGQVRAHNSMLVHVTRFNAVQRAVEDLVRAELHSLKNRLQYGDGERTPTLLEELRQMWEQDFAPTMAAVRGRITDDPALSPLTWQQVEAQLKDAALRVEVRLINGLAGDVLDYFDNQNGISVIAIGGDKLSRGLTLEGLTVSYYLRASRMYDTLMQMGRWFGYRPGYADLCRLYTSRDLVSWYRHITAASEELREEFDRMAAAKLTPEEYGLKVMTHPGALAVTSAGKMRYGRTIRVSFSGSLIETHLLERDEGVVRHNFRTTDEFVRSLRGAHEERDPHGGHHIWDAVPAAAVVAYVNAMKVHPALLQANPGKLAEFITRKNASEELTEWTVVLIDVASKRDTSGGDVGGIRVGYTLRTPAPGKAGDAEDNGDGEDEGTYVVRNRHIISMAHEMLDLSKAEAEQALALTQAAWEEQKRTPKKPEEPSGPFIREARPPERGLLLIYPLDPEPVFDSPERKFGPPVVGFAISFPVTNHPQDMVEYLIPKTRYWEEELAALQQEDQEVLRNAA